MIFLFALITSFAQAQVAIVNSTKGDANLIREQKTKAIKVGMKIMENDVISTGAEASVKMIATDKNIFVVQENSTLEIAKYLANNKKNKGTVSLNLTEGALHAEIKQKYNEEGNTFRIKTPSAVAGVRGTEFLTSVSAKETTISTFSGQVMMAAKELNGKLESPVSIGAGFQFSGQMNPAGKFTGQPMKLDQAQMQGLKNMASQGQVKSMPKADQQPQPNKEMKNQKKNSEPEKKEKSSQAPGQKKNKMDQDQQKNQNAKSGDPKKNESQGKPNQNMKNDDDGKKKKGGPNGPPSGGMMPPPGSGSGMGPGGGPNGPPPGGMMPPPGSGPGMGPGGGPNGPPPGGMMPPPPPPPNGPPH